MEVKLEQTQLSQLLREVLEVARPQLQKANVEVVQSLPADVPEVFVDRDLLKQAVLNLVLNAVEAMPGGGQIRLELTRRAENGGNFGCRHGTRNRARNRQRIFQLFLQPGPVQWNRIS